MLRWEKEKFATVQSECGFVSEKELRSCRAFLYRGFLSDEECDHLMNLVSAFFNGPLCGKSF